MKIIILGAGQVGTTLTVHLILKKQGGAKYKD